MGRTVPCLELTLGPSDDRRKLPCAACKSRKSRCVWFEDSDTCERCTKNGKVCPGPYTPHSTVAGTTSTPPESPPLSPKNDALAKASTLSLIDVRLAEEGRIQIKALNEACIITGEGKEPETIRLSGPPGAVDEVITLVCVLSGVKFSSHPLILGALASSLPTEISQITTFSPHDLSTYGTRRYHGVYSLSNRVWSTLELSIAPPKPRSNNNALARTADLQLRPEYVAKMISAMYLAAKSCNSPKKIESKRRVRKLFGWAVEQAVRILDAPREETEKVDMELMKASVYYLAVRETCESMYLGVASAVSDYAYMRCTECHFGTSYTLPTSTTLAPFFVPTPLTSSDFQHYVIPLVTPPAKTSAALLRDIHNHAHTPALFDKVDEWCATIDRFHEFVDTVTWRTISDPRYNKACQSRVAGLLRGLYTAEQSFVELNLLIESGVRSARERGDRNARLPELEGLLGERLTCVLKRSSRRMGVIMSENASALDVYHPLNVFFCNLNVPGEMILTCISHLEPSEIKLLNKAAKFAAFWDSGPGALHAAMEAMTLEDGKELTATNVLEGVPAQAKAAFLVHNALEQMV
ncbi:hypothetical protein MNV49_005531 [Pseudohyphozyma bogoriensis]|nr:hypothetical protein MNV49_005530 [Pseudohyphozyma bogoriensis]KAI5478068.1 hypothetical protein MNV49_005531 [Pseudohyphozyma bogoriensis]